MGVGVLIFQKLEAMTADYKDAWAVVGAYMLEQRTNLQNLSATDCGRNLYLPLYPGADRKEAGIQRTASS